MSEPTLRLPERPSFKQLRKQAKELQRQLAGVTLADAQFQLARQYGFATWAALKQHVETLRPAGMDHYEELAGVLAAAHQSGRREALRDVNWTYGTSFGTDAPNPALTLEDARRMVAHYFGQDSWSEFVRTATPFYNIDWRDKTLIVRGMHSAEEWDVVASVIEEHGLTKLAAGGISDEGLERVSQVGSVTRMHLTDATALTDDGAQYLSRMPQLEDLEMGGWKSALTDRSMAPLAQLRRLQRFQMVWAQGVSDEGFANLRHCSQLREVNLMGTPAGDGALRALAGLPHLGRLSTGHRVTDEGIALLGEFPVFRTWQGGESQLDLMGFHADVNHVLLDGPFTDAGLAKLAGLDGLYGLGFFWHCPNITSAGLTGLRDLPRLTFLNLDGKRCDDAAMRQIAAIPGLRKLIAQGAVATDAGFQALGASRSLEYLWGRECPNLTGAGFVALRNLRGIAVSCKNVDDGSLAGLPRFAKLRELLPMDVSDDGFRHIGECAGLERLWCMYCRETGDAATEHIQALSLRTYYAGMTKITDRSLEMLSRMESLEKLELWQCAGLTDTGIARLAQLPRLREITMDGLSNVSRKVVGLFQDYVYVDYSG